MRTVIHGRGQKLLPAIGTLLSLNGLEGVVGEGWASAGASQRQVSSLAVTGHGDSEPQKE